MAEAGELDDLAADDTISDESYGNSASTSYVTSIASEIRRGIEENGRFYSAYGKHLQAIPVDEQEQDRNDLQHCKFLLMMHGRLHLAPIIDTPQRILDLGTGSGIWAMDMADKYPSAQVTGWDVAAVQPSWVPPNCRFEIEDIENDWVLVTDSFDFIHGREILGAIRDWDKLIQQTFDHLKPGSYAEISGTWPRVFSDDETLPKDSAFLSTQILYEEMCDHMGTDAKMPTKWKGKMERIGFLDVTETMIKIPVGPWAKDRRMKKVGALELANINGGLEGFLVRGYTMILKRRLEEIQIMIAKARQEIKNPRIHAYIPYYICYGRKPESAPTPAEER